MASYNARELGELIGRNRQYVNEYKRRGVLIANHDNTFDLSIATNKLWYEPLRKAYIERLKDPEYQAIEEAKKDEQLERKMLKEHKKAVKSEQSLPSYLRNTQIPEGLNPDSEVDSEDTEGSSVHARKRVAELKIKLLDIEKRELEIEQKKGKLLNIDVAKGIVSSYMGSYSKGLFRDLETWMFRIMDIHKIPLTEKVGYTQELERLMNAASDRTMVEMTTKLESEKAQL